MKKSSFIALLLGTASGILFAIGMCLALIAEWNLFRPGIVIGCAGILLGLITVMVWRKMEHKKPVHISGKAVLTIAIGMVGALVFGVGMCFSMVGGRMAAGMITGLIGIVILLCLIPLTKGIKN